MDLARLGWDPRWAAVLDDVAPGSTPGRVTRHDGAGLVLATGAGERRVMFAGRLDPEPAVGDWVAVAGDAPVAVLPRRSLLRRRTAHGDEEQSLAANVDAVLLVCGLDRPVRAGRIQRSATLATDAGAEPVVVLTKARRPGAAPAEEALAVVARAAPGTGVLVTSVKEGLGLDELRAAVAGRTVVLLGESGAGKSSIVNALVGDDAVAVGEVRAGDAKGRHTTTSRQLHLLATGGVLVDTPGIRAVGLWVDPDAVDTAFAEVDEVGAGCRFADCRHETEPGCAVLAAVDGGTLDPARVDAWRALHDEAERQPPRRRRRR
jgi:ribosome biogenesis GTPase